MAFSQTHSVDNRTFQYLQTWWQVVYKFVRPLNIILNYLWQTHSRTQVLGLSLLVCENLHCYWNKSARTKRNCTQDKWRVYLCERILPLIDSVRLCGVYVVKVLIIYSWHSSLCSMQASIKSEPVWIWVSLTKLNAHWMDSNKPTIIMNILFSILQSCPKTYTHTHGASCCYWLCVFVFVFKQDVSNCLW